MHSRGKKIFRKFSEVNDDEFSSEAENDEVADMGLDNQTHRTRSMTRSSIKPRLLFPSKSKGKQVAEATIAEDDEEAVTDIEDNVLHGAQEAEPEAPETPARIAKSKIGTPDAPRFAPASPPSTTRTTRSTDKLRGGDTASKAKGPSPFDGWRRSKSRALPQGQKREGDALANPSASVKRQRT